MSFYKQLHEALDELERNYPEWSVEPGSMVFSTLDDDGNLFFRFGIPTNTPLGVVMPDGETAVAQSVA